MIIMEDRYVTVVGMRHYYGMEPFAIGRLLACEKESSNCIDGEAIKVKIPFINKIGYIGNSPYSIAVGTYSAGRLYDHVGDKFYIRVCFIAGPMVICKLETGDKTILQQEYAKQSETEDEKEQRQTEFEQWD